jgi:hypothetical protein
MDRTLATKGKVRDLTQSSFYVMNIIGASVVDGDAMDVRKAEDSKEQPEP